MFILLDWWCSSSFSTDSRSPRQSPVRKRPAQVIFIPSDLEWRDWADAGVAVCWSGKDPSNPGPGPLSPKQNKSLKLSNIQVTCLHERVKKRTKAIAPINFKRKSREREREIWSGDEEAQSCWFAPMEYRKIKDQVFLLLCFLSCFVTAINQPPSYLAWLPIMLISLCISISLIRNLMWFPIPPASTTIPHCFESFSIFSVFRLT